MDDAPLTVLQPLDGMIEVSAACEGWEVVHANGDHGLGRPMTVPAGSYAACGRATTARTGSGPTFVRKVYVFALDSGELRAVTTTTGEYVP